MQRRRPRELGKPRTDIQLAVVQAPVGPDESAWATVLSDAGYEPGDEPIPGSWVGPVDDGNGIAPIVVLSDGTVTWFSSRAFAEYLRPAS